MNPYLKLGIWVVVVVAAFAFLWRKGFIAQLSQYILETREELRKCTWPTWDELKGSTVVVMISIFALGAFTVGVDAVVLLFVQAMTRL